MPVIPALRRLRQEHHKFKPSLGFVAKPCLKKMARMERKRILTSERNRK
jgi:hypothetical protein